MTFGIDFATRIIFDMEASIWPRFQCLMYLTSFHDLTLFLIFSYLQSSFIISKVKHFPHCLPRTLLSYRLWCPLMFYDIMPYTLVWYGVWCPALNVCFMWGLMLYHRPCFLVGFNCQFDSPMQLLDYSHKVNLGISLYSYHW